MRDLPDDDSWIAGERLRQERLRQDLTQESVFLAARIARHTLQRVEDGREVQLSTLLRIARVLGVPLAELVQ
jgi:transcriptional regulator with XRE-family HTH domain